jgi:hypothetical protein
LLPWSSAADVFSIDVYPIPPLGHAALPNEGPWSVGDYTDILRRDLVTWNGAQRKVVWMVLQGFPWWEEEFKGGADHAVVVEWRDAGGRVLRTDGVAADRLNMARDVAIDGMSPPPGATVAALKVAAYRPGDYSFSTATLSEQGGQPLLASGGSPIAFPLDRARGEELVGTTPIQPGRRYTVTARIVAATRPSYEQTRFMAWNAIVHGARGLSWFGFQYVPEGDTLLRDIGRVATEVKAISADLLSPVSLRSVRASSSAIEAALFRGSDGLFLAVTNRGRASVDATISIDGPITSITTADAEACPLPLEGNAFRAQLEGLAVHLYRIR